MSGITTHVLDTSLGRPGADVQVTLLRREGNVSRELAQAVTDRDGRVREFSCAEPLTAGIYQLVFDSARYFVSLGQRGFFPRILIEFSVDDPSQHYHVPVLLSPFGYSTYRGS